jgi:capsule polysaccharide export protein KpsE/RkpR
MKELLDQGVAVSKDFAVKAGAKAQDLGERGVLKLEIKQLEGQAQKLLTRLGNETYRAFADRDQSTIEREAPEIKALLTEIASVREAIEKKDADIKSRKTNIE